MWLCVANTTAGVALKSALVIYFLRLVRTVRQRWVVIFAAVLYGSTAIICTLFIPFRCGVPVSAYKVFMMQDCAIHWSTMMNGLYLAAIANSVCDWIFAILPLRLVWLTIRGNRPAELALFLVTTFAVLGSAASTARVPFLKDLKPDPTIFYKTGIFCFLSFVETALGLIALSMASLMPLLRLWRQKLYQRGKLHPWLAGRARDDVELGSRHDRLMVLPATKAPTLQFDATIFGGMGVLPVGTLGSLLVSGNVATQIDRSRHSGQVKPEVVYVVHDGNSLGVGGLGLELKPRPTTRTAEL